MKSSNKRESAGKTSGEIFQLEPRASRHTSIPQCTAADLYSAPLSGHIITREGEIHAESAACFS